MARKVFNKNQQGSEGIREEARTNQPQAGGQQGAPDGGIGTAASGALRGGNGGNGGDDQVFSSDEVAERAYQIFEREGRMNGRDMDHWLQAERELRTEREKHGSRMTAENAPRSARQHQR
jgi:hypothetical protein